MMNTMIVFLRWFILSFVFQSATGMSTLGTDSAPGTPRRALKTDGTIGSFKSTPSMDRQGTAEAATKFPAGTPAADTPVTPGTSVPGLPPTPANQEGILQMFLCSFLTQTQKLSPASFFS